MDPLHSRPAPGEEVAPNPKRMRSQHSSGGGDNNNKACIVLYCLSHLAAPGGGGVNFNREYYIFIIDDLKSDVPGRVDADGFTSVSPIQIDCGVSGFHTTDAFCVLGETLYMFEGCVDLVGKSVFAIDLALTQTLTQETRKLKKGDAILKKIGDMTFPKTAPVALPTPDGRKIVVFPTDNFLTHEDDDVSAPPPRCVFELFEPVTGSWEQLPSITGSCEFIEAYGFIQDSNKFLLQIRFVGMYVLDLSKPDDKQWLGHDVIYENVERIPVLSPGPSFFETIGESSQFCFVNGVGFYDLEEFVGKYDREDVDVHGFDSPPQGLSFTRYPRSDYVIFDSRVARMNYDGERGECHFSHMKMPRPSRYVDFCELEVNVCNVDLKSYKEMAEQLSLEDRRWSYELKREKTTILKTHDFRLSFAGKRQLCEPHLFFTF